jgi:SNF2 family DNA or RNA helicase
MYQELLADWYTEFPDGEGVSADLTIVRDMRLQQIASGYVPTDDPETEEPIKVIPGPTPRIDALLDVLSRTPGKVIIWTRYILDADLIMSRLHAHYPNQSVRYDGRTTSAERLKNKERFQEGDARYFIGSPKAGGRGLTLTAAQTAVYYSHYWALEPRLQSEDRIHRIGTTGTVLYISLIAKDTIDEKIEKRRWEKESLGRMVLGDKI